MHSVHQHHSRNVILTVGFLEGAEVGGFDGGCVKGAEIGDVVG